MKQMIVYFSLIIYMGCLLWLTVLGRRCMDFRFQPFLAGWFPYYRWGKLNFDPLLNIIMMIPWTVLIFLAKPDKIHRRPYLKSGLVSLLLSLIIEVTQLITKRGTFQLADLVYNTISGLIGIWLILHIRATCNSN
jgi:glycopeptide antibiotics resistance protein